MDLSPQTVQDAHGVKRKRQDSSVPNETEPPLKRPSPERAELCPTHYKLLVWFRDAKVVEFYDFLTSFEQRQTAFEFVYIFAGGLVALPTTPIFQCFFDAMVQFRSVFFPHLNVGRPPSTRDFVFGNVTQEVTESGCKLFHHNLPHKGDQYVKLFERVFGGDEHVPVAQADVKLTLEPAKFHALWQTFVAGASFVMWRLQLIKNNYAIFPPAQQRDLLAYILNPIFTRNVNWNELEEFVRERLVTPPPSTEMKRPADLPVGAVSVLSSLPSADPRRPVASPVAVEKAQETVSSQAPSPPKPILKISFQIPGVPKPRTGTVASPKRVSWSGLGVLATTSVKASAETKTSPAPPVETKAAAAVSSPKRPVSTPPPVESKAVAAATASGKEAKMTAAATAASPKRPVSTPPPAESKATAAATASGKEAKMAAAAAAASPKRPDSTPLHAESKAAAAASPAARVELKPMTPQPIRQQDLRRAGVGDVQRLDDGKLLRPTHTEGKTVPVRPGDILEAIFVDDFKNEEAIAVRPLCRVRLFNEDGVTLDQDWDILAQVVRVVKTQTATVIQPATDIELVTVNALNGYYEVAENLTSLPIGISASVTNSWAYPKVELDAPAVAQMVLDLASDDFERCVPYLSTMCLSIVSKFHGLENKAKGRTVDWWYRQLYDGRLSIATTQNGRGGVCAISGAKMHKRNLINLLMDGKPFLTVDKNYQEAFELLIGKAKRIAVAQLLIRLGVHPFAFDGTARLTCLVGGVVCEADGLAFGKPISVQRVGLDC